MENGKPSNIATLSMTSKIPRVKPTILKFIHQSLNDKSKLFGQISIGVENTCIKTGHNMCSNGRSQQPSISKSVKTAQKTTLSCPELKTSKKTACRLEK